MKETTNIVEFSEVRGNKCTFDTGAITELTSHKVHVMDEPVSDYDAVRKADLTSFATKFAGGTTIYVPLTSGNPGQYLISEGGRNPKWSDSFFYSGTQASDSTSSKLSVKLVGTFPARVGNFFATIKFSTATISTSSISSIAAADSAGTSVNGSITLSPYRSMIEANEIITFFVSSAGTKWQEVLPEHIFTLPTSWSAGNILYTKSTRGEYGWGKLTVNSSAINGNITIFAPTSASSSTTQALFSTGTSSAPAFRAIAPADLSSSSSTGFLKKTSSTAMSWSGISASDLASTSGASGYFLRYNGTGLEWAKASTDSGFKVSFDDGTPSSAGYMLWSLNGSAHIYYKNPVLAGKMTAVSFNATSDIRKKNILSEFKLNTDKHISDLPVYNFVYKDTNIDQSPQVGIIAQDLQKMYPDLVDADDNGYLSIRESKLIYLLMTEVKELREEVKALKTSLAGGTNA